jgi:hypothetical protein
LFVAAVSSKKRAVRKGALIVAALCAGCFDVSGPFACDDDAQCGTGFCIERFCAFTASDCDSQLKWSSDSDPAHAGVCVPLGVGDLAGRGGDGGGGGGDLASGDLPQPDDGGGFGPGPLGALQRGFCCNAPAECASRECFGVDGGPTFCSGLCVTDNDCNAFSPMKQYTCDQSSGFCFPKANPYNCADPATNRYGNKPTGACCSAALECEGGLCSAAGPAATQPLYCMQGCLGPAECPTGFTCEPSTQSCVANENEQMPPQIYACH